MRTTMFGDKVIESVDDDLGLVEALQEEGPENVYAVVRADEEGSGLFDFEVMRNDDGEAIVSSDPIFESQQAARDYLRGWVSDVQFD